MRSSCRLPASLGQGTSGPHICGPYAQPHSTLPDACECAIFPVLRYEYVDAAWASFGKTDPPMRRVLIQGKGRE